MAELNDLTTTNQTNNPRWTEGVQLISQFNDSARELEAIIARGYRDERGGLDATGGPVNYALTINQQITVLFDGLRVSFSVPTTCQDNPVLNVNGLGNRNLVAQNGTRLLEFDLIAGAIYDAVFKGNNWVVLGVSNRRRGEIRLQPGTASPALRFEGFSEATSGDFLLFRGFGHNAAADTVEYGEYRIGVRDPATGQEEGRLLGTVIQGGAEQEMFRFEGNRIAFLGAALREANTMALPAGARIFAGTQDLLAATGPTRTRVFRANGTYTRPANLRGVLAFVIGGGAGGGRGSTDSIVGGGGGSGGCATAFIPAADLPNNATVTVGAGGGPGGAGQNGVNGANSVFQGVIGNGGGGGGLNGAQGAGGGASGGQANFTGSPGTSGGNQSGANSQQTPGGSGLLLGMGRGGDGATSSAAASSGAAGGVFLVEF